MNRKRTDWHIFQRLYDLVLGWSSQPHAPSILAVLSFAESCFFPIPPDVMLAPMCLARPRRGWWYDWASPSAEGLQQGGLRVGRLLLMLAGLAVLLAYTSRPRLIYGLYTLAKPLSWLGFDRRAFAVRLGLTLDYVERAPKATRWMDRLRAPLPDDMGPATYTLHPERWQTLDSVVILAGLVLVWIVLA